jgi:hypothetical protein
MLIALNMKINLEFFVTVVIIAFILYGAYLIDTNHEIIGGILIAAAILFILILLGRVVHYESQSYDDKNDVK